MAAVEDEADKMAAARAQDEERGDDEEPGRLTQRNLLKLHN